jgi:hypothetical protein
MKKITNFIENNSLFPLALFLLIVISGFFIIFTYSAGINVYDPYDYAEGVFWAEATLKSRSLVNPNYVYYYLVPLGSNVIMAPFVRLFGVSYLANQLGMAVFFVLYIVLICRLACLLYQKPYLRFLFCTITSLYVFTYAGDNLLHHLLSYGIGLLCFLGEICCVIDIRNGKRVLPFILLIIPVFWASANGIASVALSSAPVFLALLIDSYLRKSLQDKNTIKASCLFAVVTLAGLAFYRYCDSLAISQDMYKYRFLLADSDSLVSHIIHDCFADYLRLFLYKPANALVFSAHGIYGLIKLSFAVASVVFPILLWKTNKKDSGGEICKDEKFSLTMLACVLLILVCSGQYILFDTTTNRYFINLVIALFIILAILFIEFGEKHSTVLGMVILVFYVSMFTFRSVSNISPFGKESKANLENICNALKENDLTYGYATYRHHKCIDLISNGSIRNTVIAYDEDTGRYYVEYDRIFEGEQYKPEGIDRFYIIKAGEFDEETPGDPFLEETCTDRIDTGNSTICIYPIEDWDKILTVNTEK